MSTETLPQSAGSDAETIAVIGFVHGISHFFHLLLPPLFPWLMPEFGLSFAAIGTTMTVFFVVSGVGQALAGLLVDRFGAARVLMAGIACFVLACLTLHFADGLPMLLLAAAFAGLGNSVFHPADFTVLNRRVAQARLGHAFSIHGLSGNLGWAAAPLLLAGVASTAGWRQAPLAAAVPALLAIGLLYWRRHAVAVGELAPEARPQGAGKQPGTFAFLGSRPVWLCFLFFLFITAAFGVIQNFLSPILQAMYDLSLTHAASALSAYLFGMAAGTLTGGFIAARSEHERTIAVALGCAAACAILLAANVLPAWALLPVMAGIGFCSGIAGPSRDLLVRKAATAQFGQAAFGRIYGFVYSGLDLGLATAPLLFGALMDQKRFADVLIGIAVLQTLSILTALRVARNKA